MCYYSTMHSTILQYNADLSPEYAEVCEKLAQTIEQQAPKATSKVWHGHPVWFLAENPIVGYSLLKNGVQLLFWSGQSFTTPGLTPEGSFKAAQIYYKQLSDIDEDKLAAWLREAETVQWDYKNIVKHKGNLDRL